MHKLGCYSEIGQFNIAIVIEENISSFYVSMNFLILVEIIQTLKYEEIRRNLPFKVL